MTQRPEDTGGSARLTTYQEREQWPRTLSRWDLSQPASPTPKSGRTATRSAHFWSADVTWPSCDPSTGRQCVLNDIMAVGVVVAVVVVIATILGAVELVREALGRRTRKCRSVGVGWLRT